MLNAVPINYYLYHNACINRLYAAQRLLYTTYYLLYAGS